MTLKDCGIGISAADADRLFNAFFTTKSSVARNRNRRSDGRDVGHQRDVWLRRRNCERGLARGRGAPLVAYQVCKAKLQPSEYRAGASKDRRGIVALRRVPERLRIVSFSSLF